MKQNRKQKRPTIGVLAGWQIYRGRIHSFLDHVFRGVRSAALDYDCNLLIGCGYVSPTYPDSSQAALPFLLPNTEFIPVGPWNTDGLVAIGPFLPNIPDYFQKLIDEDFPVIFAGDREHGPCVKVDNEGGIIQAVDHLVEHGHRDIVFVAGHGSEEGDCLSRLRGYQLGLEKNHIPFDPNMVVYGEHAAAESYQVMQEILQQGRPFSAVISSNDESAVGVMDALRDAGLSVPQDMAVIGFDDRLEARASLPLMTTVHYPMFELGYKSVERLYQMIRGEAPLDSLLQIPINLVVRESCGCLPGIRQSHTPYEPAAAPFQEEAYDPTSYAPRLTPATQHDESPHITAKVRTQESDITFSVTQAMTQVVNDEVQLFNPQQVTYLCHRILEAFKLSLIYGNTAIFLQAIQQIFEHVAKVGDDLYIWHGAISVLRERLPEMLSTLPYLMPEEQIDDMLHQARITISEVSRGQFSRMLIQQNNAAQQIGQLTYQFFEAQTEAEIFKILSENLTDLGIRQAIIAFYESEKQLTKAAEAQPPQYSWSRLKMPLESDACEKQFATRHFPPPGLCPTDRSYQLMMLPLILPERLLGFAAFEVREMGPLEAIVRSLVAALRSAWLYQEAVTFREIADQARKTAEEANNQKSRFMSVVSHELRTPLNLIYGLSNMMLEQSQPVNDKECIVNLTDLERIDIGAQHLESLIRDVLDLARSDLGQLRLMSEDFDPVGILKPLSEMGEHMAREKELDWRLNVPDELPFIHGDRTRLRQVILNLIYNAVKFTEKGWVALSSKVENGYVTISIQDTGLGIPLEDQCMIFDEFRQSSRTTGRGFGGLGLGLSLCKRLVEMHGGEIGVTSSGMEGEGSTFYLQLPIIQSDEASHVCCSPDEENEHILLLTRDMASSETLAKHLNQQGFMVDVHFLEDGCEWMKWLQPSPPDKIVLDVSLSTKHGWEIFKKVKENPTTQDIPVLFYTLGKDEDSGSFLNLNLLTKPLNPSEISKELFVQGLVAGDETQGSNRSILVVDDDREILTLHQQILKSLSTGYRILKANGGKEALEILQKERPALVLLDLMMPEVDGFTVLETMQAHEVLSSIPVIVLTSHVLNEEDMARLNCGVASVLSKGMYTYQETLEHISEALSRKRKSSLETKQIVHKAMAYIHDHYKNSISRKDVASYVGVQRATPGTLLSK